MVSFRSEWTGDFSDELCSFTGAGIDGDIEVDGLDVDGEAAKSAGVSLDFDGEAAKSVVDCLDIDGGAAKSIVEHLDIDGEAAKTVVCLDIDERLQKDQHLLT